MHSCDTHTHTHTCTRSFSAGLIAIVLLSRTFGICRNATTRFASLCTSRRTKQAQAPWQTCSTDTPTSTVCPSPCALPRNQPIALLELVLSSTLPTVCVCVCVVGHVCMCVCVCVCACVCVRALLSLTCSLPFIPTSHTRTHAHAHTLDLHRGDQGCIWQCPRTTRSMLGQCLMPGGYSTPFGTTRMTRLSLGSFRLS